MSKALLKNPLFLLAVLFIFQLISLTGFKDFKLTDSEITHILITTSAIDIESGKLAKKKARHYEVRGLAEQIVDDHLNIKEKATNQAVLLDFIPKDNPLSQELMSEADENFKKLKSLSKPEFDKVFLEQGENRHQKLLQMFDQILLPQAKNDEIKSLVKKARESVQDQLERAQTAESQLSRAVF